MVKIGGKQKSKLRQET